MSGARANLLVEIGTEELPPRALQSLARAFADELARALAEEGMLGESGGAAALTWFATPRRLAVRIKHVAAAQPRRVMERRGPSLRAAYDAAGKPTRAALGFAKSCGVSMAKLQRVETEKGAWLVCRESRAGKKLAEVLSDCLAQALRRLPTPKRMRWGGGEVEFVRPAHWLLALHGARAVKVEALGLRAGRHTRGHRFHADRKLAVPNADAYEKLLEKKGMVIADFARRRAKIQTQLAAIARKRRARVADEDALLDLVTGMVEWPQTLAGEFDKRYLKLPPEALASVMRDHQKYFPLAAANGKLLPAFAFVANIKSKSPKLVRQGNERVLRARLADAEFFLEKDLKVPLEKRREELKGILFHQKLGTLHDKSERIASLAGHIAEELGADADCAKRAAELCKADLASEMVGEFPELQGVIGRYCAQKHGETKVVADAIEQHYLPRHAGDKLPRGEVVQSVALADRLDSLVTLFAVSEIPSGDKDPFALRRAALGVLRIIIEMQLDVDIEELLQFYSTKGMVGAVTGWSHETDLVGKGRDQLLDFILDRLNAYYRPMGYRPEEIAAVRACRPHKPLDFDRRLKALSRFFKKQRAAAESLAAANKRIANILGKAEDAPENYDRKKLIEKAELRLADSLEQTGTHAERCFAAGKYDDGLAALSKLRQPVDAFFDEVLVMAPDENLRKNRLALLRRIRNLFLAAADISHLRPGQKAK